MNAPTIQIKLLTCCLKKQTFAERVRFLTLIEIHDLVVIVSVRIMNTWAYEVFVNVLPENVRTDCTGFAASGHLVAKCAPGEVLSNKYRLRHPMLLKRSLINLFQ